MEENDEKQFSTLVAKVPSLHVIDVGDQLKWVDDLILSETFQPIEIGKTSRKNKTLDEQIEWIIDILKQQKVKGEFFLSFGAYPFGKVELGEDYRWIKSIWQLKHFIQLVPIDQTYYLFVKWTECCMSNDCIVIKTAKNPTINQ